MILAISRFRVANGMETEVVEAFLRRPRLVDDEPGFLGLEVFTEARDRTVFHLVTRWTDVESYRRWHKSDNHRASHRWIPRGLKLDAQFTEVLVLNRLADEVSPPLPEETVIDSAPFLASFLEASETMCLVRGDVNGMITAANGTIADALQRTQDELVGTLLTDHLVVSDAEVFRRRLEEPRRPAERFLLHFTAGDHFPFTLSCQLDVQPDYFVLLGEPPAPDRRVETDLVQLNNELSTLAREHARTIRELEGTRAELQATLDELNESYWHLKKIQEVLPICMECGKVKTGTATWESVADYLRRNSLFLSHGYCPDCADRRLADLE